MMMRKILFGLMAAAMVVAPAFAQDAERPKKKMPSSPRYFTSLAKVAESQLTYTIRSGCIFNMVSRHASSQPLRGGSTTITSG